MNDADRIARQRKLQSDRAAEAEEQRTLDEFKAKLQGAVREVEQLATQVLAALERRGWPNGDSITVVEYKRGIFGTKPISIERAAWTVGTQTYHYRGDDMERSVALLSTGQFAVQGSQGWSVATFVNDDGLLGHLKTDSVLAGLQDLLTRYS